MNLPGINWPSGYVTENCQSANLHEQFLEIIADHGLVQVTDKPTRYENTLDLITVNNPTLLNRLEVIPGISDHDAVFAELDISPENITKRSGKFQSTGRQTGRRSVKKSRNPTKSLKTTKKPMTLIHAGIFSNLVSSRPLRSSSPIAPHRLVTGHHG